MDGFMYFEFLPKKVTNIPDIHCQQLRDLATTIQEEKMTGKTVSSITATRLRATALQLSSSSALPEKQLFKYLVKRFLPIHLIHPILLP